MSTQPQPELYKWAEFSAHLFFTINGIIHTPFLADTYVALGILMDREPKPTINQLTELYELDVQYKQHYTDIAMHNARLPEVDEIKKDVLMAKISRAMERQEIIYNRIKTIIVVNRPRTA